jgi:excisionase family DNA binding protein
MSTDPLLTPQDVAERLNVKIRTAYDMLAPGGVLHHLRIDLGHKTIRVRRDALEQFIEQQGATAHASS